MERPEPEPVANVVNGDVHGLVVQVGRGTPDPGQPPVRTNSVRPTTRILVVGLTLFVAVVVALALVPGLSP
ncbi:hypothetical protein [Lentzea sp. NBRC 102530]|uniref:hypothetical protein n=1 Tax=Lentzea sp. NBRC 102530 TaxID=3032201 RepID=UPI002555204D|nr:hypothetical protein [Lentzea sp. NBRC 102530]